MSAPYYEDDLVTLYHGDCREMVAWLEADVLVTDPPYPNNAGHFDDAVVIGRWAVARWTGEAIVFWTEVEIPPAFHFAPDGIKRRSLVLRHAAINDGATGSDDTRSSVWSAGHPTQKPVGVMETLIGLTRGTGTIADPFSGSGSTLVAAKHLGRRAIGVEVEERYCEITATRLAQDTLGFEVTA